MSMHIRHSDDSWPSFGQKVVIFQGPHYHLGHRKPKKGGELGNARAKIFGKLFKLFSHFLVFLLSLALIRKAHWWMRVDLGSLPFCGSNSNPIPSSRQVLPPEESPLIVVIEPSNQLLSGEAPCWALGDGNEKWVGQVTCRTPHVSWNLCRVAG